MVFFSSTSVTGSRMKAGRLQELKRNLVVQDDIGTFDESSDEIGGEELEVTTPIQRIRINSNSPSPAQVNTTANEVIRAPQPPPRSPTRPSTLSSLSTDFQPPMTSTSGDPMSPEPESVFDGFICWDITETLLFKRR
ncbi:hypothetical protein O181_010667 [Austropuccinia psidii MF-1]|uniref:Uncharacterized protein n=1 Tax=Austropuccinia psidii MF-1 TaxID=1389203 RepID=A0A9Q3GLE9_9BASI|nr:hypothetical protein [Austropuccinia psidii MF-1]